MIPLNPVSAITSSSRGVLYRRLQGIANESSHLLGVLDSRRALDAAGDIDAVRPHDANGLRHVFGCETAGEDQWIRHLPVREQVPRRLLSRAAVLTGDFGIEEDGESWWFGVFEYRPNANSSA